MGIVTLDREISQATCLTEALKTLLNSGLDPTGLLRVVAGRVTGYMIITSGYIRGVYMATNGEKGLAALNQLLAVRPAMFTFSPAKKEQLQIGDQGLQIHIESIAGGVMTTIPTNQTTRQPVKITIPVPGQKQQPKPQEPPHQSLTADQLTLLATYRKLTGPMDRMAFLKENPIFVKLLEGGDSSLTDTQKSELEHANFGIAEKDTIGFLEFHRRVLGDAQEVSEQQINMVRELYRELHTEERRRSFLFETGLLDESLAVSRGEHLWSEEQAERIKQLDAINTPEPVLTDSVALVQRDGDYSVKERDVPLHKVTANLRKRRRGDGDIVAATMPKFWFFRPEVVGVIVSVTLVFTIGYMVYAQVIQSAYIAQATPEEDVVTMDLILDEALGVEIPRTIKDAQIIALIEGGGNVQGAALGDTGNPRYWKEQAEVAKRMLAQGRIKEAKTLLSNVVQQDPYDVAAREVLVEAYLKLGQRKEARAVAISGLTYSRQKSDRDVLEKLFLKCIGD